MAAFTVGAVTVLFLLVLHLIVDGREMRKRISDLEYRLDHPMTHT